MLSLSTKTSSKLHLDSGGATTSIQIDSDTEASIDFNDHGGSAIRYKIGTNISDNNSQFEIRDVTNSASRMRIDSSGKVGIGETSMDALLVIKGNSDASTTPSIRLKDGSDTREAWISNTSGDLVLANGGNDNTPHCKITLMDANIIYFSTANTPRIRIDSDGLKFNSDSAAANALDDYEEGTWTPTFAGYGSSSYSQQVGQYTKIGNFVIASCQLKLASDPGGNVNNVHIEGLPFAGKTGSVGDGAFLSYQTNFNSATDGRGNFTAMVNSQQAGIRFYTPDGTYYQWNEVNDRTQQIRVTATYRTN